MSELIVSFQGKYKIANTIVGTTTDREINFQLITNSKYSGTDIPFGSFGKVIVNLDKDIGTCTRTNLYSVSGQITVVTNKIDDKDPSSHTEVIKIGNNTDLANLLDFMSKFIISSDRPAPQSEVMDNNFKEPLLLSKQHAKLEDDPNSEGCCAVIKSKLRCLV